MENINKVRYSLFQLERKYFNPLTYVGEIGTQLVENCCIHLGTFDTLGQAKLEQKERDFKTIILESY